ncbi:hypothetical protein [Solibacillus isronensis]|uniref:hypothetical protein n=1 Tax=Solibacillus isronensis TaxID=412383 RepID=UPI0039A268F2
MIKQYDEKEFLESQLQWVKQRDAILAQIENKLYEMKQIVEHIVSYEISMLESQKHSLNKRFLLLKNEVDDLEYQLHIFYN